MDFYKKVVLLKEVSLGFSSGSGRVGGILRLEHENGVTDLNLSLVNLKHALGDYHLFVVFDKKTTFSFPLGKRPFSFTQTVDFFPSLLYGFSAGLVYAESGIPTVVAFCKTDTCPIMIKDFKKIVVDKFIEKTKDFSPLPDKQTCFEEYNDEVVATENYFDFESDIKAKIFSLKESEQGYVQNKDALFNELNKEKEIKEGQMFSTCTDATDDGFSKAYNRQNPYYLTVKEDLEKVFNSFPKEESLCTLSVGSQWAKINYSKDKYYVVGLIKEDNEEKYICYGVPAKYSKTPPKELKGFCSFVPLSVFDLKGDGYFMMFQDAVTGKCVKLD